MSKLNRDVFGGAALVVVGGIGLLSSLQIDAVVSVDPLGPRVYPEILLGLLVGLGVLLIGTGLRHGRAATAARHQTEAAAGGDPATDEPPPESVYLRPVGVLAIGAVYVAILGTVGYLISTFALLIAFLYVLDTRSAWRAVLLSAGTTVVLFAFFDLLLGVPLPAGVLG